MKLRKTALVLIIALLPSMGLAQTAQDSIVSQLTQQGFRDISVSRTFLGRVRITAISDELRREIVFNRVSGEIIRDYWEELDDDDGVGNGSSTIFDPRSNPDQYNEYTEDSADEDDDSEESGQESRNLNLGQNVGQVSDNINDRIDQDNRDDREVLEDGRRGDYSQIDLDRESD